MNRLGNELWAIVGSDVPRNAAQDEEVGEDIDHRGGVQPARHPDRQALAGELVNNVEHAILPAVMGPVLHKVIRPHYYFRGGIAAKGLVPVGKTVFYGEYGDAEGGAVGTTALTAGGISGIVTESDFRFYGAGIVQTVPAAELELYVGYKRLEADVATSTLGRVATEGIDIVGTGARIKF